MAEKTLKRGRAGNLMAIGGPQAVVYIGLAAILIIAQIISPGYLKMDHILTMLRLAAFVGIASIGQTFAVLTGGIDLSIAYVITFANIVGSQVMYGENQNLPAAVLTVLAVGAGVGLVNSMGIKFLKIPPFIMTLGVGTIVQGIYMIYSGGAPKGNTAPLLREMCGNNIFGRVSGILVLWFILSVVVITVLKFTPYGRKIYAVGINQKAARFSGINVSGIIFSVYIISGITAAITGFLLVGFTGTSYLDTGTKYATTNLAAVVIGGTAITGGRGGYGGTIAGAIIMTVIDDLLVIINISQAGRQVVQGIIILLLVFSYSQQKKN
ncbi:ABC transporter permease [Youxingia wuxianensis]|uniref:Autoinducer 2 import system permease protein LsrD n=1 Tax=Youxingia wuxianensis TaxID=2763678 RepID=A0A926EL35_9FIRM|nr:ABC transporter permease [Youxingia wuxianensis]MBC8585378.1 ABC transporter permease [Youxingia wuxianensis]